MGDINKEPAFSSSEERLKLMNKEWKDIFDAIADLIFIMDINNVIVGANKAFLQAFNMGPEEVIGKKCFELLHKTNKPWYGCPFEETKVTKKAVSSEVIDPNIGIPLLVTSSPLIDNNGRLMGIVHVSQDISVQKKIETELRNKVEELERFQKITVDRELKMKELKERVAQLEAKLEKR